MTFSRLLFVVAVAAAGCSGAAGPDRQQRPDAAAGAGPGAAAQTSVAVLDLRFDQTLLHGDVSLRWVDLEDSRCPIGVTCVWAGQTVVSLELRQDDGEPFEVALLRRPGREPETVTALGRQLTLLDVEPHPREGQAPARSDYVAQLEIAMP